MAEVMLRITHRTLTTLATILTVVALLCACSGPQFQPASKVAVTAQLSDTHATMSDGYQLPFTFYPAINTPPKATVIALHGFNDYRRAFTDFCHALSKANIECYAYDQRGFGETQYRGLWPTAKTLQQDLASLSALIRAKAPTRPLYLAGESMGGAVIMSTMASRPNTNIDGVILLAPAVWARHTQPWYQRTALWLAVNFFPGWTPTGEGLKITPTDNRDALYQMWHDPFVIKATRIDTLYGVNNLMDKALASAKNLPIKGLVLYGKKDEIIPKKPTCKMLKQLDQNPGKWALSLYNNGYHMLTRDLQAERVFNDVTRWILTKAAGSTGRDMSVLIENYCNHEITTD